MCSISNTNDLGLTDKNSACSCNHGHDEARADSAATPVAGDEYLVDGMTCQHCVASVTEEISSLDGVESVNVSLNAGGTSRVIVSTSAPVSADAIRDAVEEAGYSLAEA